MCLQPSVALSQGCPLGASRVVALLFLSPSDCKEKYGGPCGSVLGGASFGGQEMGEWHQDETKVFMALIIMILAILLLSALLYGPA